MSELISPEETKELYLQMLEIRKGSKEKIEDLLNLLVDLKARNLKKINNLREELKRREELDTVYSDLIKKAKETLKLET